MPFAMTTYLYTTAGTAKNGNRTVTVAANRLKFSFNITNWPWKSANNLLLLELVVSTNKAAENMTRGARSGTRDRWTLTGGTIDTEAEAVLDGVNTEIETVGVVQESDKLALQFWIPYFADTMVYDPVMGLDTYDDTGGAKAFRTSVFSALVIGLVLLLLSL